ncbi:MAG: JAB domain-containing protein [Clostridia bacterium]|nr:JAB domain-containing protein [Clostridia bacterium]
MSGELNDYLAYFNRSFAEILAPVAKGKAQELAARLIDKFKSVEGALCAQVSDLNKCVGEKVAMYLKTVAAVTSRRITDLFEFGIPHTKAEVADYFIGLYLPEEVEKTAVMLKDENDAVIECKMLFVGTVNASDILPRKIVEAALSRGSRKIVIAHNHPRGAAVPSEEDKTLTVGIRDLLSMVGITLEYHVVVAGMEANTVEI